MKIAVTGATGWIGSHVATLAQARGHEVVRVLRDEAHRRSVYDVRADLTDLHRLSEVASHADAVLHCAANDDPKFLPVARAAVEALILGLPAGGCFAMQGGSVVFGDTGREPVAQPQFAPPPPLAERATFDQAVLDGLRSDVRARIVYGSFLYGGSGAAIPSAMVRAAVETGAALYFGDGDQVWSTAHVGDFAALLVDAVERNSVENMPLFAAGRSVQIRPVANILGQVLGLPARPVANDEEAARFGMFAGALQINQHFCSENSRALFGWRPSFSDDPNALASALTHHASHASL